VAMAVGVLLAVGVGVAEVVDNGLGLEIAVWFVGRRVALGGGTRVDLGAQAAKSAINIRAQRALFSMPALYQLCQSAFAA
jgi:hypothetical protein